MVASIAPPQTAEGRSFSSGTSSARDFPKYDDIQQMVQNFPADLGAVQGIEDFNCEGRRDFTTSPHYSPPFVGSMDEEERGRHYRDYER